MAAKFQKVKWCSPFCQTVYEASSVREEDHKHSMTELRAEIAKYNSKNVYNSDGSVILYCDILSQ
eukprot:IDg17384t1